MALELNSKSSNGPKNTSELIEQSNQALPYLGSASTGYQHIVDTQGQPYTNHFDYIDPLSVGANTDLDELRARGQSAGEQWLHGLGKFGLRTVGSAINTVVAPLDMMISLEQNGNMYSGPIGTFFDTMYEKAEEWMPNYYTQDEQTNTKILSANFLADKALKNAGFTIGTMAGMLATGGISAGLIGKGMRMFGKASKSLSELSSKVLMAEAAGYSDDAVKLAVNLQNSGELTMKSLQKLDMVANARTINKINKAYQITSASLFESASETREGMKHYSNLLEGLGYDMNTQETQDMLDQFGREVFTTNMAILTLSNAVMFGSMLNMKGMKASRPNRFMTNIRRFMDKESREAIEKSGLTDAVRFTVDIPGLRKASRVGLKSDKVLKYQNILDRAYNFAKVGVSEGLYEEGGQFAAQTAAIHSGLQNAKYGDEDFGRFVRNLASVWADVGTYKEGRESMILGAMTGGISSMVQGIRGDITGQKKKDDARDYAIAQRYTSMLHGLYNMSDSNEDSDLRSFLNYYSDKIKNGKLMYKHLNLSNNARDIYEEALLKVKELKLDNATEEAIKKYLKSINLQESVEDNRVSQLYMLSALAQTFEMVDSLDMLYKHLDDYGKMDNKTFSNMLGLEEDVIDDTDKAAIIDDMKKQLDKVVDINQQISNVRDAVHPDALYTIDENGELKSPLLDDLRESLVSISAYDAEYKDLIEDFDYVMKSPTKGGISMTFAEVKAYADANNTSLYKAYKEIYDELYNKSAKESVKSKDIDDLSIEVEAFSKRGETAEHIIGTINHIKDYAFAALQSKMKLEAALLDNKDRAAENRRIKNETVDKYITKHLNAASSIAELDAIESHFKAHKISPERYGKKLNERRNKVGTLEDLKAEYEDAITNAEKIKDQDEIARLKLQIKKVDQKLKGNNLTSFNLDYIDSLLKEKEKLDTSKLKENVEAKKKKDKAKKDRKDKVSKAKQKVKDTLNGKTSSKDTDTTDETEVKVKERDLKTIDPNEETKQIVEKVLNGLVNDPNKIDNSETLQYKDDITDQLCDPRTNRPYSGGARKAKNGMTTAFTPGGKWSAITTFKGRSHAHGGIDIAIGDGKISMTGENANIKAANGMLITARDYIKDDTSSITDKPPTIGQALTVLGLNPKDWRIKNYSDIKTFDEAYNKARNSGRKEFIYKGKRYNTNYNGTKEEQLRETGITDEQLQGYNEFRDRVVNNIYPVGYGDIGMRMKQIITNTPDQRIENNYPNTFSNTQGDALRLVMGKPQINNSFTISKYAPTIIKDGNNKTYYTHRDMQTVFDDILYNFNNGRIKKERQVIDSGLQVAAAMGKFTIDFGKDDRGEYISIYDINDYAPIGQYGKQNALQANAVIPVGKPFEIYDRVYYKIDNDGKYKKIWYTDKELSELDANSGNFDVKRVQEELLSRGYKLPNSTTREIYINWLPADLLSKYGITVADIEYFKDSTVIVDKKDYDMLLNRYNKEVDEFVSSIKNPYDDISDEEYRNYRRDRFIRSHKFNADNSRTDGIYGEETKAALLEEQEYLNSINKRYPTKNNKL